MKTYKAASITLKFPDNLFDPLERDTVEHVIKCYLERDETFQSLSDEDRKACVDEFLDQIKPRGSCWSIV